MRKGIPYSIGVHVVFLTVAVLYGHWVPSPAVSEPRPIRVHIVEAPRPTPPAAPPVVKEQPAPERPPEVKPAPPPEPKPAKVPQKKPKQEARKPEPPQPRPEPRREQAEAPQEPPPPQPVSMAAVMEAGPQVASTDEPFPHDWYLELVRQRVLRGWNPAQVAGGEHTTAVHFFIERNGQVARPAIARASGIGLLDREALRAVQAVGQLPPLPREFGSRQLGVTFEFTVKSGP